MQVPKYKEISNFIISKINSGTWAENEKLPSENDLAELLDSSRMTVRKSLEQLVADGLLYRRPSVGTFVAPKKVQSSFLEIRNIADEIKERGHQHSSLVLSKVLMKPTDKLLELLKLDTYVDVVRVVILHQEDGKPFQLEERYVNAELVPDFFNQDFTRITCNEYLNTQLPVTSAEISIEAITPPKILKHQLGMNDGDPCLKLTRITTSGSNTVSFANLYHSGNAFKLTGKLVSV
ncbi:MULTISPECIES: UTRA domain-containing protein [unclassified Pseudoalteromonas]|uniref:UTRA domain-containing protein n=1 Tax=unclassified Pseudoalteromonas TaxID=194690 RepID=UPI000CF69825|nr:MULTISPECIES: UTRA domain-containing protein [unclassified Pseudoalteromonas]